MCLRQKVKETVVFGHFPAVRVQIPLRILSLQFRQRGPCFPFLRNQGVLKSQPKQTLVLAGFFLRLQASEELLQLLVIVVLACKAEDTVPIDISHAIFGVKLEVRSKAVICSSVPDQVICPFFLQVGYFLHHITDLRISSSMWHMINPQGVQRTRADSKTMRIVPQEPQKRKRPAEFFSDGYFLAENCSFLSLVTL